MIVHFIYHLKSTVSKLTLFVSKKGKRLVVFVMFILDACLLLLYYI
jgi:hypothetical protein